MISSEVSGSPYTAPRKVSHGCQVDRRCSTGSPPSSRGLLMASRMVIRLLVMGESLNRDARGARDAEDLLAVRTPSICQHPPVGALGVGRRHMRSDSDLAGSVDGGRVSRD